MSVPAVSSEAASLRQFQANNVEAVRDHIARVLAERANRKIADAEKVADLLLSKPRPGNGAAALLLDVLA